MPMKPRKTHRLVSLTLTSLVALYAAGFGARIDLGAQAQPPAQTPAAASGSPGQAPLPATLNPTGRSRSVGADFSPKTPVKWLSPSEELKTFTLPNGYHLELVLSEPDIMAPVAVTFDGNGRMYVVEMRTYMLDADGNGKFDPKSRISLHQSTKGDGVYDKHTIFLDNLVLPRMALPLDDSILTMETNTDEIYRHWDTNRDGVADKKELFYSPAGRRGNLEHQQSGFVWALDNRIYSTYNAFRLRWTPKGVERETTGPNNGQWGVAQDDYGKPWFVDAGGEQGPMNFQFPIRYGSFTVRDGFEPEFDITWSGGPGLQDVEGGMPRVRVPLGVVNHFTAAAGPEIYRGDRLPADLRGDLLFGEPVARIVRRAKVVVTDGMTQLRNAYRNAEFISSTDPIFRPINMTTAPDGTIYIVDMYHGIIQESEWTRPGSYLRHKIEQYEMEKIVGHGRIWRLVYDGISPDRTQPRMLDETPAQLLTHLSHPNGWWRDTAQRQLVLRQDRSVVPALQEMARISNSLLGRFHAMWTLEGLGALDAALVRELLADPSALIRVQAIRASESLYYAGDASFADDYAKLAKDPDTRVVMQALLTLNLIKAPNLAATVQAAQAANKSRGVTEIGAWITRPPGRGAGAGRGMMTPEQQGQFQRGNAIFTELCFSCHGSDGRGAPMGGAPAGTLMAPPLAGSPRVQGHRDYVIKALLHGLGGPIEGNTYPGAMVPMGSNDDEWVAAVASYVRNAFGNTGTFVTPADVSRVRAAAGTRGPWAFEELTATVPVLIPAEAAWKASASHSAETASGPIAATGGGAWSTQTAQQNGMWFQIELPEARLITEVQIDSPVTFAGRGGGPGAGGPPAAPAAGAAAPPAGAGAAAAPAPAAAQVPPAAPPQPPAMVSSFARGYRVQVSSDGKTWSAPVAEGQGSGPLTAIPFSPVRARFVRITQTATVADAPPWVIQRIRLYQPALATRQ